MTRGRKKKPTEMKLANGSARHDPQRLNQAEPKRQRGRPRMPVGLSAAAVAEWEAVCEELDGLGVLAVTDRAILEQYARAYDAMLRYWGEVLNIGAMLSSEDLQGQTVWRANPAAREYARSRDACVKILSELGLTPTSNARLRIQEPSQSHQRMRELLGR